jgi:hypothetical protein
LKQFLGYQQRGDRLLRRHLKGSGQSQNPGDQKNQFPTGLPTPRVPTQHHSNRGQYQHASGKNTPSVQAINHMPCGQGHDQGRDELKQANQAQIPGAASQLIHVPTDCQHQHLMGRNTKNARKPETHELTLREQL